MQTQKIALSKIKPNPNNPRVIKDGKFRQLVQSIKDFPEMLDIRPIVVNSDMIVLGGNMRLKACKEAGLKEVPVFIAENLTDEQQREFIVKDNLGFGEWDFSLLLDGWEQEELEGWGMDFPSFGEDINPDEYGEDFTLPDGDRAPFQQMTFTLADEQAEVIKNAIADIKQTEAYKYAEPMGNENSNGNALYLIVSLWAGQRI